MLICVHKSLVWLLRSAHRHGIKDNDADHLAHVGRRQCPLLFGNISIIHGPYNDSSELKPLVGEYSIYGGEEETPPLSNSASGAGGGRRVSRASFLGKLLN